MVEKRGAEPERLETRPGRTEKSPVARWPAPFPGPGSPKSPRRRPTDNRKEPRHHPPTLGTSLQRLIHRPGGPPGTPSPESSTSARGPSSAPARGPPLQRRLSEGAGRASPEPGPRGVGLRFERAIQTENPKTKPRGEFRNFPCRCELDSLNLRGRDLGWTVQARTAPRRSQEPGAEKEWGMPILCALTSLSNLSPDLASPGCQVQGSVNTKPFLQYDSDSNKVKPLGFLGKEVNDTKVWTELSQTLAEAGKELRMVLPFIKLDKKEMRASMDGQLSSLTP
ncbi:uncharacterized protein LOC114116087 [Ovis aries]|uniref:uncharacterized protein LOC114116087 n=1 Tax=Ovis aries TaxID=9940 RepID=UPI00295262FA|nr:uncharacterized protein LOC114116087 [Ovis aries]